MKPDVVADIGNSRIKWGFCTPDGVARMASLPPDDLQAWHRQFDECLTEGAHSWVVAGVQPETRERLVEWLRQRGDTVHVLDSWRQVGVTVALDQPDQVGIDRLLNAVAAKDRVKREVSILIVDAGSAVTVDWVDEEGQFRGGAIIPGCRLMIKALHDYTALLPLVEMSKSGPVVPGTSTQRAIESGVFWAVAGGIKAILRQLAERRRIYVEPRLTLSTRPTPVVFLTGGDAAMLGPALGSEVIYWPSMTLDGIRVAAEGLS